jgi:hypothetical protein
VEPFASVATQPVFARATRFGGSENRLTEVFAAVLERVPELAWNLARNWTDPTTDEAAPGEIPAPGTTTVFSALRDRRWVFVRTQVRTDGNKQIDLALRFGATRTPSAEDVVVWVELKHGANPHDQQLANYVRDLPRDVSAGAVILLAPRTSLPYDDSVVPEGVAQRSWQAAGRSIHTHSRREPDPIAKFLLEEMYAFMQHENLVDPDVLRPEHFVVFAYSDAAENALTTVCERASQLVARERGRDPDEFEPAARTRKPAFGWGYWEAWSLDLGEGRLGKAWLDWNARSEPAHPEAEGRSLVFIAGLAAESLEDLTPRLPSPERLAELEAGIRVDGNFVRFKRVSDDCERLCCVAFPEEVLVGRTLEEQAGSLAAWIVAAFKALTQP